MTLREPLFAPEIESIAAAWRANPVVTGKDAFTPVPSRRQLQFKQASQELTASETHILALPYIDGATHPKWMWNKDGHLVVVKKNVDLGGGYRSAGREKIAADLAYDLNVPAGPVCLWETRNWGLRTYYIVSLCMFPDARPAPLITDIEADRSFPDNADRSFPVISAHDQFVRNIDRKPDSIIAGTLPDETTAYAGVDYSHTLCGDAEILREPVLIAYRPHQENTSLPVRNYIDRAQNLSDSWLRETVYRLPSKVFESSGAQRTITEALPVRRDNLPGLIARGLESRVA